MGKSVSRPGQGRVAIAVVISSVLAVLSNVSGSLDFCKKILAWGIARLGFGLDSLLFRHQAAFSVLLVVAIAALVVAVHRWKVRIGAQAGEPDKRALRREKEARDEYLQWLSKDVEQRIKGSIHSARELDLGLTDSPGAVEPWHYVAYDPKGERQVFASFTDAFDQLDWRVLLLGAPGSGKSTTLLFAARHLLTAAKDPQAPIPVRLNLSSFQDSGEAGWLRPFRRKKGDPREDLAFDRWLVDQLALLPVPGREIAARWVEEGRIALLLDGLDEVDEDAQPRLLKALDESYLKRFFFVPVVVCSRTLEYQRLADRESRRLGLKGAVTLEPLGRDQIRSYLAAAQADDLAATLAGDEQLDELARSPLTLSMMTVAYGGLPPPQTPAGLPLTERRGRLFDAYVDRMMQRVARRRAGKPFDDNPALDEPTEYSRGQVDRFLGWFAVRLSERARTEFSPARLLDLLRPLSTSGQASRRGPFWTDLLAAKLLVAVLVSAVAAALVGLLSRRLGWTGPLFPALALAALAGPLFHLSASFAGWTSNPWVILGLAVVAYGYSYGFLVPLVAGQLPWSLPTPVVGAALLAAVIVAVARSEPELRSGRGLLAGGLGLALLYWGFGLVLAAMLLGVGQVGVWLLGAPSPFLAAVFGAGFLSLAFGEGDVLNRCAYAVLVARGTLPARTQRFLGYAVETLLLKRAGRDYEFVHRLLRDHFAIRDLQPLLHDERGRIRLQVLSALSYQGDASFDALAELARHTDPAVREAAVEGLGRLPTPKVGPLLGELLHAEPDAAVRRKAVESLRALGWKESGKTIWKARWDPDPAVRLAVIQAAAHIGEPREPHLVWSGLWDEDGAVARAAAEALGDVPLALAKLEVGSPEDERRLAERLPAFLADESDRVRGTAARLLGYFGDEKHIELLTQACRDRSSRVREVAICALGEIRARLRNEGSCSAADWSAVEGVLAQALADRAPTVRRQAARTLGHFAGGAGLEALLAVLADRDGEVRGAAVRSLVERQGELDPQRLLERLAGRSLGGVLSAVVVLEVLKAQELRPELLAWLERGSRRQKRGAALALGALRAPEAAPALHRLAASRSEKIRRQIARWLRPGTVDLGTIAATALLGIEGPQETTPPRPPRRRLRSKAGRSIWRETLEERELREIQRNLRKPSDRWLLGSYTEDLLEAGPEGPPGRR